MTGVISGTVSPSSSSSSSSISSPSEAGGEAAEEEATDLGLRTSYSTAVVFVVFFFLEEVSNAPGRGSGSGLEEIYCDRGRNV